MDTAELVERERFDGEEWYYWDEFVIYFRFVNIDRSKPKEEDQAKEESDNAKEGTEEGAKDANRGEEKGGGSASKPKG